MSNIVAKDISKVLGEQKSVILKDINFTIEPAEFVALTGKSGSGKSTLLYILSTLDKPSAGELIINNKNITKFGDKELHVFRNTQIGFVFQFHYLLPELSAFENVCMPMRKFGLTAEKKAKAKEILDIIGLADKMNNLPRQLSGGQMQRVAIARALAQDPKFLFADEPTGNLDSENSKLVFNLFKKINSEFKTTIVMVTHDEELAGACSRKISLKDGMVVNDSLG